MRKVYQSLGIAQGNRDLSYCLGAKISLDLHKEIGGWRRIKVAKCWSEILIQ